MDLDNQNQSVDGMRSSGGSNTSGIDGFKQPSRPTFEPEEPVEATPNETSVIDNSKKEPKKSNKTKTFMIIFIILFIAAAAAAGYFYWQYSNTKKDLDSAKSAEGQTTQLQQENAKLKSQNDSLQATVNSQTQYISSLLKVTNQLKTTCGNACASIVIPPVPSNIPTPTVTTTPKASVTPTVKATLTATPKPTTAP